MSDMQMGDAEWDKANKRRHELIDAKFTRGLTDEELAELEAIGDRMDEATKPFYDAAMKRMEEYFDRLAAAKISLTGRSEEGKGE